MISRPAAPSRTILAVAHDIGGAQAIYPVIAKLRRRASLRVNVIAGGFARKVFARLRPENMEADWSESEIDEYLDQNRPNLVLSSTSWKSPLEQRFRNGARFRNIPSVVVIDFWSNYRLRWHDATYAFEESQDQVCVPDREVVEVMVNEGYPKELIHITGQPHLERCYRMGSRRQRQPEAKPEVTVLFLTIPLAALGLKEDPVESVRVVCEALEQWHTVIKKPVCLTVRPHPHETLEQDFIDRVHALVSKGIQIRLADRTKPILGQLKQSDVVLGFVTMGLFETRSLGKQALAIKLAEHPPELIAAMEDAGIPLLPFDAKRIASVLCQPGSENSKQPGNTHVGATAAIAGVCCDLIAAGRLK